MTKEEVSQRVLKNGKPLDLSLFTWNEKTNTFSSKEEYLVIDFKGIDNCTFNIRHGCTLIFGYGCTFNTGSGWILRFCFTVFLILVVIILLILVILGIIV